MIPCINATLIPAPCPLKQNHGISQNQATPFGGQLAPLISLSLSLIYVVARVVSLSKSEKDHSLLEGPMFLSPLPWDLCMHAFLIGSSKRAMPAMPYLIPFGCLSLMF